jgi:hypothetical protein
MIGEHSNTTTRGRVNMNPAQPRTITAYPLEAKREIREIREIREARDRVLAREVGIEIGRRRERERQHRDKEKAWGRGFMIGLIVAVVFVIVGMVGAERAAAAPAKHHQTLGAKHEPHMPSAAIIRAIIRIGQCEQPAPKGAGYFANIKWDAYPGKTWPGGLGIMQVHHEQFRPPGAPKDPTKATPAEQIRTAWRAYKHYRRIYGIRGGSTFWVCSKMIGFGGVDYDGRVIWR